MKATVTRDDIDYALASSPWDLGNEVLYTLCRDHPKHDRGDAIIAKLWLIGRAYAAAIERRKNADTTSDEFYETTVVEGIKESGLDKWLAEIPEGISDPWKQLASVVAVHWRLMDLFKDMTKLSKRSLASKYLHFHRPDAFFLYDSRVRQAITKVTPTIRQITRIECTKADPEYLHVVRRCQWLRDSISQRFGVVLTPRQIDNILLRT